MAVKKTSTTQLQLERGDVVEIKTSTPTPTSGKNGGAEPKARKRRSKLSLTVDGMLVVDPGDLPLTVKGFGKLPSAAEAKKMEAEMDAMLLAFRQSLRRIRKLERESDKINAKTDAVLARLKEV